MVQDKGSYYGAWVVTRVLEDVTRRREQRSGPGGGPYVHNGENGDQIELKRDRLVVLYTSTCFCSSSVCDNK